jgi:Transposase DDE domain group 1
LIHTAAYWLLPGLRGLASRNPFWRDAQFDTIRLCLIKVAARVTEMATRTKVAPPSAFPYQASVADLAEPIGGAAPARRQRPPVDGRLVRCCAERRTGGDRIAGNCSTTNPRSPASTLFTAAPARRSAP